MVYLWLIVLGLQVLTGENFVNGQNLGNFSDLQAFLNYFCPPGSNVEGCTDEALVSPNAGLPTSPTIITPPPTTPPPPTAPTTTQPPVLSPAGCADNGKRCPQLQKKCVPSDFDCNLLDLGITCRVPSDYGVQTQVLLCGDGTSGVRCGLDITVPILTVLLVKCQGSNEIDSYPVQSLNVISGPGDEEGAGVYECSASKSWEPQFRSPFLNQLTVSCRNAGCGSVSHPSDQLPVHRRWPMVRAIYKDGKLHCSATLVSPGAAVTAAHCLTSSTVSNKADEYLNNYELDIPGPFSSPMLKVSPDSIYIHPRYNYNNGELQNDVAIMFFSLGVNYNLPTVCIADRPYRNQIGNAQIVFSLQGSRFQQSASGTEFQGPVWGSTPSEWDSSCITTSTRVGGSCIDVLRVQQSQFCASHQGLDMKPGSSGGPYLAEVSNGVKESWVLMGVLSRFSNSSSCNLGHSIYGQVADDTRWLKDCVYDKRCG